MTLRKNLLFLLLIITLIFSACNTNTQPVHSEPIQENPSTPPPIVLTLTAVGDNLIHNTLSFDSRVENGYDFYPIYEKIAPKIQDSDLAIINQEVPLNGKIGSFPYLAAPQEVATALKEIGFNVAVLSNNHIADQGIDGMIKTAEAFEANNFLAITGITKDNHIPDTGTIIQLQGVKIGLLSYTYGLNTPIANGYVNIIDEARITNDVTLLREQCDFLLVSMHWGDEYQANPNSYQKEYAKLLADLEVDLILGHHPHVVQPLEWIIGETGHKTLCAYSLGNFVSNQHKLDTMLGGCLSTELIFSPDGTFESFGNVTYSAVVTHFSTKSRDFVIYPLEDYTDTLAAEHGLKNYDIAVTCNYFSDAFATVLP